MNDFIQQFGKSKQWLIKPKTVFVEGTTDVDLFKLTARLNLKDKNMDLLSDLAIVAAGEGDRGGTPGVLRELTTFRNLGRRILLPNGKQKYRFIGLFDNDHAGRLAVSEVKRIDTSVLEFRDVFRLWPAMPSEGSLDIKTLKKAFEKHNSYYPGLDWEIEDLLPNNFISAFLSDFPNAVSKNKKVHDKIHRDFTRDGKAQLHKFIKENAILDDLNEIIHLIKALRFYLGLPSL
jgi:hypothetical protein